MKLLTTVGVPVLIISLFALLVLASVGFHSNDPAFTSDITRNVEGTPQSIFDLTGFQKSATGNKAFNVSGTLTNFTVVLLKNGTDNEFITNITIFWRLRSNNSVMFNTTLSNRTGECGGTGRTPDDPWSCENLTYWNLSIDTTTFVDGIYNISIRLHNITYDETVPFSYTLNETVTANITVDNTPPQVTEVSTGSANYSLASSNRTFNASLITDATLAVYNVIFSFDNATGTGFNLTAENNSGDWGVFYNVSQLSEGAHTVRIFANDSLNVNTTQTITFTVDFTPPQVTEVSTGSANYSLASSNRTFNASLVLDTNLSIYNVIFSFDNATGTGFNLTAENHSGDWGVFYNVSQLSEGAHTVRIFANDSLNVNTTEILTFTVDFTPPQVTEVASEGNFSLSSSNRTFNASLVLDTNLSIYNVIFSFDNASGTGFNLTGENHSGDWGTFYNVSLLAEGAHTVRIFANDSLNVNTTEIISFKVDFTAPTVNLLNLSHNTTDGTPSLTFNFSDLSTNANCSLYVNNTINVSNSIVINGTNTVFTSTALVDADYNFSVNCTDSSGHVGASSTTIIVDNTQPGITAFTCNDVSVDSSQDCSCTATDKLTVTTSINTASTASSGTKTVTCTATDALGNAKTQDASYSVTTTGGGAGAGGAGGGVSQGATGQFQKRIWTSIGKDETAKVEVENGEIGVTSVEFGVEKEIFGAWVKVAKEVGVPSSVGTPSGKVYKYLSITKGQTVKDDLLKDVTVNFKVTGAWLKENKLSSSQVVLLRHNGGKWNTLPTRVVKEGTEYVEYSATTPGFSYFAIGQGQAEEPASVPVVGEPSAEPLPAPAVEEAPAEEAVEKLVEEQGTSWGTWLIVVLVLAVLAALVYFFLPSGKKK